MTKQIEKLKTATERVDSLTKRMDAVVASRQDSKTVDPDALYDMLRNIDNMSFDQLKRLQERELPENNEVHKTLKSLRTMLKFVLQGRASAAAKKRATAGRSAG